MSESQRLPPCPCCQFLPDDLFLPVKDEPNADVEGTPSDPNLLTPTVAWQQLQSNLAHDKLILVDTHGHAHLGRSANDTDSIYRVSTDESSSPIASLTCAVSPEDWQNCLDYTAQSRNRMAALGVHPWYLEGLADSWLEDLRGLLLQHPGCMVGEMGLCKQARFLRTHPGGKQEALQIQRNVFVQQLALAAELQRAVSVHCVNQQGVLLEILQEQANNLPPAIALHSYTGTAHQVQLLLRWEESLQRSQPLLYFGFSHTVNYAMCSSEKSRRQGRLAIRTVPRDRLLAESDVHDDNDVAGGTAGAVAYLAWALEEPLPSVADLTRRNGLAFLQRAHG